MLHTLLIAAALIGSIAAIAGLLIYITKRQSRIRNQRLKDDYKALLAQHHIHPQFSQVFEHRILALDTSQQVFAFVQHDEALPSAVIHMAEVADCQLWKDGIQISHQRGKRGERVEEYVSAIGLSFKRRSGVVINVPVYTEALDGIEERIALTKAADQWLQRLKNIAPGASAPQRQHAL
jgi:hypothetical protein